MSLKAVSVRLNEETLESIGQMASSMDRPRAWLMAQAISQYVATQKKFILAVEKGLKAADEGRLVDHTNLKAKWESRRANQVD